MNIKLDKEKLTAYVLGELDQQERAEVEQALADDEGARDQVDQIRAAAEITRELFAGAPELTLNDNQRETIASQAAAAEEDEGAEVVSLHPEPTRRFGWPLLRVAAVFLMVIGTGAVLFYPMYEHGREPDPMMAEKREPILMKRFLGSRKYDTKSAPGRTSSSPQKGERREAEAGSRQDMDAGSPADNEQHSVVEDNFAEELITREEQKDKKQAPVRAGGKQAQPMDQATRNRLQALGYLSDESAVSAPRSTGAGTAVAGRAAPPAQGRDYGRTSVLEKEEFFGYEVEGDDATNNPNLNHWPGHNTEAYDRIEDNPFRVVTDNPLSTFSIDVDTAAYSNMRRFISQGQLPPPDSVRIEELVNYFNYDYETPRGDTPFSANVAVAGCPWNSDHRLARVGLKGWEMEPGRRPASNLVFLLDVSGSMSSENKLPLLKDAMSLLVAQLGRKDSVAIAVYAGASGLVLPSTSGDNQRAILGALDRLQAGGSTNGGAGIELAYDLATRNFIKGGVNRVILATDGDFNVGTTNRGDLTRMIEEKAKSGVFLTVLGFGMGNLKDATMENLADKGNGNYAYIDTIREAKKVLVDEIGSTMVTIAKDVKIQVEFNPAEVAAYRLVGYENRILAAEDFNDDTKDAGEIGAGHTVTALYEIVPVGVETTLPGVDPLKYQRTTRPSREAGNGELFTIKLRYKKQDGDKSKLLSFPVTDPGTGYDVAPPDFKFAAAVASFGMILRGSPHKGSATFGSVIELAQEGQGRDAHGYRAEFIELVRKARSLK